MHLYRGWTVRSALVTGGAGFIGSHLVDRLLTEGWRVTAVDNFDPYYDPEIKRRNIAPHLGNRIFELVTTDIRDMAALRSRLSGNYDVIVHLAAKAGVRPSIKDPITYQEVNIRGTQNMLELAKEWDVKQFVFASSSSVYGINPNVPWREDDCVLLPISPYAATKVAGELLGHVYSYLYGMRFIALRFFTVYGPRQRPDLAINKFARKIMSGETVPIYGDGSTKRDYTYVDDIIDGVRRAMNYTATPYEVVNLGNNQMVGLLEMVQALEEVLGVRAQMSQLPMQSGDVPQTWADVRKAGNLLDWHPRTFFLDGLERFAEWTKGNWEDGRVSGDIP
jgi:UDP-glucuronate 4-epimerase